VSYGFVSKLEIFNTNVRQWSSQQPSEFSQWNVWMPQRRG